MNVKLNDNVLVITGKDKGVTGKVTACFPKLNRVTVQGVNQVTKHQKPKSAAQPGEIIHKEMPVDASNVMVICPKCGKAIRVGHKVVEVTGKDGKVSKKSVRVCNKCGAEID